MVINKIDFPIYNTLIIFSIIVGAIYIYISVDRENVPRKNIFVFFLYIKSNFTICTVKSYFPSFILLRIYSTLSLKIFSILSPFLAEVSKNNILFFLANFNHSS